MLYEVECEQHCALNTGCAWAWHLVCSLDTLALNLATHYPRQTVGQHARYNSSEGTMAIGCSNAQLLKKNRKKYLLRLGLGCLLSMCTGEQGVVEWHWACRSTSTATAKGLGVSYLMPAQHCALNTGCAWAWHLVCSLDTLALNLATHYPRQTVGQHARYNSSEGTMAIGCSNAQLLKKNRKKYLLRLGLGCLLSTRRGEQGVIEWHWACRSTSTATANGQGVSYLMREQHCALNTGCAWAWHLVHGLDTLARSLAGCGHALPTADCSTARVLQLCRRNHGHGMLRCPAI